jgi:hypothetical protein
MKIFANIAKATADAMQHNSQVASSSLQRS